MKYRLSITTWSALFLGVAICSVYIYLFTFFPQFLGIWTPLDLAQLAGVVNYFDFTNYGALECFLIKSKDINHHYSLLILLLGFAFTFILPEKFKKWSQVTWSLIIIFLIHGPFSVLIVFVSHLVIFYIFHRLKSSFLYLKLLISQVPLLIILSLAFWNWMYAFEFTLPLGIMVLCWQWIRLTIYYLDLRDGLIPDSIHFGEYMAVFFCPSSVILVGTGYFIGQGYSYLTQRYSTKNYNEVVKSGVRLMALALFYLLLGQTLIRKSAEVLNIFGLQVSTSVRDLVMRHVAGENLSTSNILVSCVVGQLDWFFLFAGIFHAKVGIWRLFGYNVDPNFNKPWLSTNMVSLWARYAFHFRAALLRVFYFPLFIRLNGTSPNYRVSIATIVSVGFGGMLWIHLPHSLLVGRVTFNKIESTPPFIYFILLAMGIVVAELYLMKVRKLRKPWSYGWGLVGDIFAASFTFIYFSLIHIFARPVPGGNLHSYFTLFLKGVGIPL